MSGILRSTAVKKRIVIFCVLTCCVVAIAFVNNWLIKIFFVIGLLCFLMGITEYKKYRVYIGNKVPSLMGNMTRNYDEMILGDENSEISKNEPTNKKCLNLTNYGRNLYTDVLIMERWYSFLKKGGTVCFSIDCGNKRYLFDNNISLFDDEFMHQVTMLEHGKDVTSKKYKAINYGKSFLFSLYANHSRSGKRRVLSEDEVQRINKMIERANMFCQIRNIHVEYIFYNCNDESLKRLEAIIHKYM